MSITAGELKRLHMAAERGDKPKKSLEVQDIIDREKLHVYLCKFAGVSGKAFEALVGAGFSSLAEVNAASDGDLTAVKGIGSATLAQIRDTLA